MLIKLLKLAKKYKINIFVATTGNGSKKFVAYCGCNSTLREIVENTLNKNGIDYKGFSLIFYKIKEELAKQSLVEFIGNESFEDFLDYKIKDLLNVFSFSNLHISVDISGIGGEIEDKNGIKYYIKTRNEHNPPHIHCKKQEKECKCDIKTLKIKHISKKHFIGKEVDQIQEYIKENNKELLEKWNKLNPNLKD